MRKAARVNAVKTRKRQPRCVTEGCNGYVECKSCISMVCAECRKVEINQCVVCGNDFCGDCSRKCSGCSWVVCNKCVIACESGSKCKSKVKNANGISYSCKTCHGQCDMCDKYSCKGCTKECQVCACCLCHKCYKKENKCHYCGCDLTNKQQQEEGKDKTLTCSCLCQSCSANNAPFGNVPKKQKVK